MQKGLSSLIIFYGAKFRKTFHSLNFKKIYRCVGTVLCRDILYQYLKIYNYVPILTRFLQIHKF